MPETAVGNPVARDARRAAGALRRFLGSGELQSPHGAFCAWRDGRNGALAFEYPEITGYALSWIAGVARVQPRELEAGARAADWLAARLSAGDRSARDGWDGGAAYNFDLGMIAAGLISFSELTGDASHGDVGLALSRELAAQVRGDGGIGPLFGNSTSSRPAGWSTAGRAHLGKCVQALLLAGETDAARSLIASTGDHQADDGHFVTQPGDERVMLHPHLYAVEGLWMWADSQLDDQALARAVGATTWAWTHQLPSGGMPRWVAPDERGPEQTDVTAQAVRAAILLGTEPPGLERAVARLCELATGAGDGDGLVYAPASPERHLNAWVTMFGAQALTIASEGAEALEWNTLV